MKMIQEATLEAPWSIPPIWAQFARRPSDRLIELTEKAIELAASKSNNRQIISSTTLLMAIHGLDLPAPDYCVGDEERNLSLANKHLSERNSQLFQLWSSVASPSVLPTENTNLRWGRSENEALTELASGEGNLRADEFLVSVFRRNSKTLMDRLSSVALGSLLEELVNLLSSPQSNEPVEILQELKKGEEETPPEGRAQLPNQKPELSKRIAGDNAPLNYDGPTSIDDLNRAVFAESIAKKINKMMDDPDNKKSEASFAMQLSGQWGAGKTSFINLLETELCKKNRWLVVKFNAWENQRIDQPWWVIYQKIFDAISNSKEEASTAVLPKRYWTKLREFWWRTTVGNLLNIILLIIGLIIVLVALKLELPYLNSTRSTTPQTILSLLVALVGLLTTGGSVARIFTNGLLGGSSAAKGFLEAAGDPMRKLREHYGELVENAKKRILIAVDDIDRCMPSKVVAILEGMQTVFGNRHVAWIVAGDGRWIASAFEANYDTKFTGLNEIAQPGNRFGYQYLEKLFQFTITLPVLDEDLKLKYWRKLINDESSEATLSGSAQQMENAAARAAKETFESAKDEGEVIDILNQALLGKPEITAPLRQEAVRKLTSVGADNFVEQFLRDFSFLLRPNPRSMKRLANTYTMFRDSAILSGIALKREEIARCAILALDAPLLLDALERDEQLLKKELSPDELDPALRRLWKEDRIHNLLFGCARNDLQLGGITGETIKAFSRLRG